MFTWICPDCGAEVPPAYRDCPRCHPPGSAPEPPRAANRPVDPPPAPRQPEPPYAAPPQNVYRPEPQRYEAPVEPEQYRSPQPPAYEPPAPAYNNAPPSGSSIWGDMGHQPPPSRPSGLPTKDVDFRHDSEYQQEQQRYRNEPPRGYEEQARYDNQRRYEETARPYGDPRNEPVRQEPYRNEPPRPESYRNDPPRHEHFRNEPRQEQRSAFDSPYRGPETARPPQAPERPFNDRVADVPAPPPRSLSAETSAPPRPTFRREDDRKPLPPPPPPARTMPAWMATALTVIAIGAVLGLVYFMTASKNSSVAATAPSTADSATPAAGAEGANSYAKNLELAGFRISEDKSQKIQVKFLVINHSNSELPPLNGDVTLRTGRPDAVINLPFKLPSMGPLETREVTSTTKSSIRAYELPDWQYIKPEFTVNEISK